MKPVFPIPKDEVIPTLLERLDDRLKNAHYWLVECTASDQSADAINEARGIVLRLKEKIRDAAFDAKREQK